MSEPLNHIEISTGRIRKNMQLLKEFDPGVQIAPVLKSNAYGHGIAEVGKLLEEFHVPFYCVNSIQEAHQLREAGIKTDILIMGYVDPKDLMSQWDYIFTVIDMDYAKVLDSLQKNARVHIHVETGLHREGVDILNSPEMLDELQSLKNLTVEGMMSHLACSNDPECPTTKEQLKNFTQAKKLLLDRGFAPQWFHLGGSLALLNKLSSEVSCNVVRCGKAIFGIALNTTYAGAEREGEKNEYLKDFQPVLTLKTKIGQIKHVKKGDHVGYADAFISDQDMTLGILPIGYNDGVDRRMTNKGVVKVGDKYCPVVGIVAMNVTTVDLSSIEDPKVGDEVVIYSSEKTDNNSLDAAAKECGTLPQDLLLHLPSTLKRRLI